MTRPLTLIARLAESFAWLAFMIACLLAWAAGLAIVRLIDAICGRRTPRPTIPR